MSDLNFSQLLAEQNQAYQDAKEFNDWMPDDGEYVIAITACDTGVSMKDEIPMLWWKHTAEIVAGEDVESVLGKVFTSGFFTSKGFGQAKSQTKVLNGGDTPETVEALNEVLSASVGIVVKVEIKTTVSKKNGREYTNCYYREVLDTQDAPEEGANAEPPQEQTPPQDIDG